MLFMDLSKFFDTINRYLFLAKLHAYDFFINALNLMRSYSKNRKQRVQINNNFIATKTFIDGVLQGSIDGTLLFMLINYADDNNLFSIKKYFNKVKEILAKELGIVTNWFYENFMVSYSNNVKTKHLLL